MTVALRVDVSLKHITVSNHTGSIKAATLNDALKEAAQRALDNQWGSGYNEDCLSCSVEIYNNYPRKAELIQWIIAHGPEYTIKATNGRPVTISWQLRGKDSLWHSTREYQP